MQSGVTDENQGKPSADRFQTIIAGLSTDQTRFVIARNEYPTDKKAAKAIGVKPATVSDWKYKGIPIDEAVKLMAVDGLIVAQELRRRNLGKAMGVKVAGLDSDSERTRQGVASEIIEWEMGKAMQRKEITGKDGEAIVVEFVNDWRQRVE